MPPMEAEERPRDVQPITAATAQRSHPDLKQVNLPYNRKVPVTVPAYASQKAEGGHT